MNTGTLDKPETTTAEGRGGGESTPSTSAASPQTLERGTGGAETAAAGSQEAAPLNDQASADADRRAFDALAEGKTPDQARTIAQRPATPAAGDSKGGEQKPGSGEREPAADAAADLSPRDGKAAPITSYGEIEEGSYHAMNRVNMLPPPEQWALMPSHARGQMVAAAKSVLKAKQQAHEQTNAAPGKGAGDTPTGRTGGGDDTVAGQLGDDDTPAGQQRVGAATGGTAAAAGEPELDEDFQAIADYYGGEEAVPKALRSVVNRVEQRFQTQLAEKDAVNSRLFGELAAMQARTAFKELENDIPQVKDPAQQREVLKLAASIYKDQQAAGEDGLFTFGDAVATAARAKFQPNLKQQAQRDLLNERTTQLQGTSGRVGENANANRAATPEEQDKAVYDALAEGKTVDEARALRR